MLFFFFFYLPAAISAFKGIKKLESDCGTTHFSRSGLRCSASEKNAVNSHVADEGEGAFIFCSYSCGFSTTDEKVASLNVKLYECKEKINHDHKRGKKVVIIYKVYRSTMRKGLASSAFVMRV